MILFSHDTTVPIAQSADCYLAVNDDGGDASTCFHMKGWTKLSRQKPKRQVTPSWHENYVSLAMRTNAVMLRQAWLVPAQHLATKAERWISARQRREAEAEKGARKGPSALVDEAETST